MAQIRCPDCKHPYDPSRDVHYQCRECATKRCMSCSARCGWKCPTCKSPFGTLDQVR